MQTKEYGSVDNFWKTAFICRIAYTLVTPSLPNKFKVTGFKFGTKEDRGTRFLIIQRHGNCCSVRETELQKQEQKQKKQPVLLFFCFCFYHFVIVLAAHLFCWIHDSYLVIPSIKVDCIVMLFSFFSFSSLFWRGGRVVAESWWNERKTVLSAS